MVMQTDLDKASFLSNQLQQINLALDILGHGGRIMAMTVSGSTVPVPIMLDVSYISYPPQMIETIKTGLNGRITEIRNELSALGVTGVDEERRRTFAQPSAR